MSKKPNQPSAAKEIPEHLEMDILSRVPVKTVLRCRCVCKRWSSLLLQPIFVKLHLKRSVSANILMDTTPKFQILDSLKGNWLQDIQFNLIDRKFEILEVVGNSNGLFCFLIRKFSSSFDDMKFTPRIIIYNPSTGVHNELPTPLEIDKTMMPYWGFGYDSGLDDYKVVLGLRIIQHPTRNVVMVLNIKDNHWRTILDKVTPASSSDLVGSNLLFRPIFGDNRVETEDEALFGNGVSRFGDVFNGKLLWIHPPNIQQPTLHGTVCFDLSNEVVQELPWKKFLLPPCRNFLCDSIGILQGHFCVTYMTEHQGNDVMEMWIMKEFGTPSSWTNLLNVPCDSYYNAIRPVCFLRNGELVLDVLHETLDRELVVFSPLTSNIRGIAECGQPHLYVQSLVSPYGN